MSLPSPRSILSSFSALFDTTPDRHLFTWVDDQGRDRERLTVRQLAEAAGLISGSLAEWGLRPGDRVALVYPPGLEFVKAFVGCLAAGVVPVPVYPPDPFRLERDLATFQKIIDSSGALAALTNATYDRTRMAGSVAGLFGKHTQRWPRIPWHRTDGRLRAANRSWYEPEDLHDTAFLQYTSGSTADPKGVMVTHANLVHEIAANVVDLRLHEGTRGVFWIPQYHDMGLINVILSTVVGNSTTYLMSPLTFLQRPDLWLDTMSRVGATVTSAPNFAYELVVRKTTARQRAEWDLSALEMAICAAEPVQDRTVRKFLEAFAVSGIRPGVFFTAYGLAENTASVTNRGTGRVRLNTEALEQNRVVIAEESDEPTTVHYGCGRSSKAGDRIRIVDPETNTRCGPDEVGEIWVRSSTTAAGYWGMPSLSEQTFHATINGDDDRTGYLRTGDLGFLLDGELYVTGRIKDLMVVRGRNIHPSDIEDSVRDCHPLIRPGGVLVFSISPGEADTDTEAEAERIVVTVEVRAKKLGGREAEEICAEVRRAVHADHQLACDTVVIGTVGLAKKTTSGKLRRQVCKRDFLRGEAHHLERVLHVSTSRFAGRLA